MKTIVAHLGGDVESNKQCGCDAYGEATQESNPNGSANNIAGIINEAGNVLGMMPHPERSCEAILGSTDGNLIFQSIIESAIESNRQA